MINRKHALQQKLAQCHCVIFDVDGVLTDGGLYFSDAGAEYKRFDAKDGLGMKLLLLHDIEVGIITGRKSAAARARLVDNLGIIHYHEQCHNKLQKLQQLCQQQQWQMHNIVYVGDDLIDLSVMRAVGTAVAVADAVEVVQQQADWVLENKGGKGAAREIAELILQAKNLWQPCLETFIAGKSFNN